MSLQRGNGLLDSCWLPQAWPRLWDSTFISIRRGELKKQQLMKSINREPSAPRDFAAVLKSDATVVEPGEIAGIFSNNRQRGERR